MLKFNAILIIIIVLGSLPQSRAIILDEYVTSFITFLESLYGKFYVFQDPELLVVEKKAENITTVQIKLKAGHGDGSKLKILNCSADIFNYPIPLVIEETIICTEQQYNRYEPVLIENDSGDPTQSRSHNFLPKRTGDKTANNPERNSQCTDAECSLAEISQESIEDLVALAIRHLDKEEPTVQHTLHDIIRIQQYQGIKKLASTLLIEVNFDTCSIEYTENCIQTKTCLIHLVKNTPLSLSSSSKYIAPASNNCTNKPRNENSLLKLFEKTKTMKLKTAQDFHEDRSNELPIGKSGDKTTQYLDLDYYQVKKIALDSLKYIDDGLKKSVIKINSAKMDIASGKVKEIIFDVSYTVCTDDIKPMCAVLEDTPTKICKTLIRANVLFPYRNLLNVTCSSMPQNKLRVRRKCTEDEMYEAEFNETSPENVARVDFKSNITKFLLNAAVYQYQFLTNNEVTYDIDEVKEIYKNLKPPTESSEVEEYILKFNMNNMVIQEYLHCHTNILVEKLLLTALKTNITCVERLNINGGLTFKDPTEIKFAEMAIESLKHMENVTLEFGQVVDVHTQIVDGLATHIEFIAFKMKCVGADVDEASTPHCKPNYETSYTCYSRLVEKNWSDETLININCDPNVFNLHADLYDSNAPNETILRNNVDEKLARMAEGAVMRYETETQSIHKYTIIGIRSAFTEVINGYLTKLIFDVAPTFCSIDIPLDLVNKCIIDESKQIETCHADFWDGFSLHSKNLRVYCHVHGRQISNDTIAYGTYRRFQNY